MIPNNVIPMNAGQRGLRPTRKISAAETVRDIRAGMTDAALMNKYQLSSKGLQSLFTKLRNSDLITDAELDERTAPNEKTVELTLFRCPACGMPQLSEFDECPQCGIILCKYPSARGTLKSAKPGAIDGPQSDRLTVAVRDSVGDTYRGNMQRTGFYETKGIRALKELKWKFRTGG